METTDIRQLRRRYLQQRHSDRFKDALFVWLDESYCNQQHVNKKVSSASLACMLFFLIPVVLPYSNAFFVPQTWFSDGMTVLLKNNGRRRRYVIVHAGCEEGRIGEPMIWEANTSKSVSDYHDNMNSKIFEDYMDNLCRHCAENGHKEVVFCMDNAKYRRREFTGSDCEQSRKTLNTQ